MSEPTAVPAHPWTKTFRTLLAGLVTAAVLVPLAVNAAGIDVTAQGYRWIAYVLGFLAAVTRIMAVPQINAALQKVLGLGSKDVEAAQVVALQVQDGPAQTVVAGEASVLPTGEPLQVGTTVGELGQTLRGDDGYGLIEICIAVLVLLILVFLLFRVAG